MRFLPVLCLAAFAVLPLPALAEGKSIIVLDASGSMWGQIDGRAKLEIAREALGSVLSGIDPATEIGLMAYGHREKGACDDIELVVPPAAGTGQAIIDAANEMKFLGKTPLSEAVRRAAEELRSTEAKATVILITDGIETCEADPCALGAELEASGVDFTAHVVGFGLTEDEGKAVACLAENTGGTYIQASDAGGLVEALKTTVAAPLPEPEPVPAKLAENVDPVVLLAAGGAELAEPFIQDAVFSFTPLGADGQPAGDDATIYGRSLGSLAAGSYRLVTTLHEVRVEQMVVIGPETMLSTPTAVLDAGILDLKLLAEAGGEPAPEASWELRGANDLYTTGYASALRVVPAGEHALSARLGAVSANDSVVITAGAVTEKTIVLAAGIPVLSAFYAPGVLVEGDQTFVIYESKAALDGSRTKIDTLYGAGDGPELPPGDYVATASVGRSEAETPFTVKAGERVEVAVVLNAGIVAATAANANQIDILAASKSLDGTRERLETFYGPEGEVTLPAGDYVAVAYAGEASAETPFTVIAAERTAVAVVVNVGAAAVSSPGASSVEIVAAKPALDGSRKRFFTEYGELADVMLPPGDYLAIASRDYATAEAAFSVSDGQRTEVTVTLVMGKAAINAPGAARTEILVAKPGLDGKRDRLHTEYSGETAIMLPPGDYVALAYFGEKPPVEAPFSVTDGQQVDVSVTEP
jgi:Ca-activated chloride channel family protein